MEAAVYGLTHSLTQQANVQVKVITYPDKQYMAFERINYTTNLELVCLPNQYGYVVLSVLSFATLIREIRNYKPDVCHLHGTTILVFLISLYLRIVGINYVVTVHGIASVEYTKSYFRSRRAVFLIKKWVYGFIELLIINYTQKIVVDTEYVKEWVQQHRLWPCKQLLIAPQGINERYYRLSQNITSPPYLISIGSISERKGFDYAIKAFKQAQAVIPDLHFYIIGFLNDKAYYQRLITLIHDLSLDEYVHIIVDATQDELTEYLQKASLFVLHSHEESQGIVFCEAMALGKPIVATQVGGVPYVVKNGVNGLLSTYGDTEVFTQNIVKMLTDTALYQSMVQANKEEAKRYNWHSIADTIYKLYNQKSWW